ncbi:nuclear transport factor 2 family protein [Gilvimarinus chinensis]|uniref:nuclear transport factor 2 family protein n=1 Tax=Gilvimarinus chinensis TaxID=396005 RepID=UPI00036D7D9A|nr:nuclear transport factor 2 family protein [Gilvimarinus chinensis]
MNAKKTLIERLMDHYKTFNTESVNDIAALYHENTVFIDPVTQIEGRESLQAYFTSMAEGLKTCRFEFEQVITQQQEGVYHTCLTWVMTFIHPKLNSGAPVSVPGVSYLQHSADAIYRHRDYYDLGAMLYEKIPVLGTLVSHLRKRLEH